MRTSTIMLANNEPMNSSPHISPVTPYKKGLVEVFTGDGKGKTTAALGTIFRAVGHGLHVCIVHFMKGQYPYGEYKTAEKCPNVTIGVFGRISFVDPNNIEEVDKEEARKALDYASNAIYNGKYDIVILDEVNIASGWGLIDVEDVIRLIKEKPDDVELILTGRYADKRIIDCADLVTEMVSRKHPYEKGIKARLGIEY